MKLKSTDTFNILDFRKEEIRMLHLTWTAFFLTFFVWFNFAPMVSYMLEDLKAIGLGQQHMNALLLCNVALTIPGRVAIGAIVDRYGPRKVFSGLMVIMAIPGLFFAFGTSFTQLVISRLLLSVIGAGFVIGIRMTGQWFGPKHIGRAEGIYAGWGNFGSAAAAFTIPTLAIYIFGDWRWSMAFSSIVCAGYGVFYFFAARDLPRDGATLPFHFQKAEDVGPMLVSSYADLVQYLLWSFPLYGTLGVLAWRLGNINIDGHPLISSRMVVVIYALLGLWYVFSAIRILNRNLPHLRANAAQKDAYHWGSIAVLNATYFANFGAELAVVSMLPIFFYTVFENLVNTSGDKIVTTVVAGVLGGSFAVVNLVARPLGGYLSDTMGKRKTTMLIYMAGIALGFMGMAMIAHHRPVANDHTGQLIPMFDGIGWLVISVILTMTCSIFVQGAEGATFAMVPLISPKNQGKVAGMTGAYGNIGAICYLLIYSLTDARTFFLCIAVGATLSMVFCQFMLREPASHRV